MKRFILTIALAAAAAASGPARVQAQPHIDGAPAVNLVRGGELRLTGTGFGIKDPVAPVLFDDFENGTNGANVLGFPGSPWDNQYSYGPPAYVHYTDSLSVDGRGMCAEVYHPTSANLIYLMKNYTPTGKFYFDADHKMRFPEFDRGVVTTQCKPMRVRRQSDQNLSLYAGRTMCDDDGNQSGATGGYGVDNPAAINECYSDMTNLGWTVPFGWLNWMQWTTWQWWYEAGTPGQADAYSKVEYNCQLKNETHTLCDIESGGQDWDQLIVGGQASTLAQGVCPAGTQGCYTFWDHVYFDTSWMRIEIGNNPVYDNCTRRAVQVPTAWSQAEVVASVHMGQFSPSEDLYAFVIDENNVPSNGYPIRVGQDLGAPGEPGTPIRR